MLWKFLKLEVFEVILSVFAVIPPKAELLGGSERLLEVPWAVFYADSNPGSDATAIHDPDGNFRPRFSCQPR